MIHSGLRTFLVWSPLLLVASAAPQAAAARVDRHAADARAAELAALGLAELTDAPLSAPRVELLELAFAAASAFPSNPHAKNRARAQEQVVRACVELDQYRRAACFAGAIDGWERGTGYAELAYRLAERGSKAEAERCLDLAQVVAEKDRTVLEDEGGQTWRRDRILAQIARARLALGQDDRAHALAAGLLESETTPVATERAARKDATAFDEHMAWVDQTVEIANFDLMQAALATCVQLFDTYYDDAARRDAAEAKLEGSWGKLPIGLRVEYLLDLGQRALGHGDRAKALALAAKTKVMIDGATWTPEMRVEVLSHLASLRHRAGDTESARADAAFALAYYDSEKHRIVDIDRADALRPLAEAYQAFGDRAMARKVYVLALEAGQQNPNSRPRCQDLVATCCSMAVAGCEPDPELLEGIRAIRAGLGDPW